MINALYRVGFDYCKLRNEHAELVGCLERKDAVAAKELLASHYNLVIKGYKFDAARSPDVNLKFALQI